MTREVDRARKRATSATRSQKRPKKTSSHRHEFDPDLEATAKPKKSSKSKKKVKKGRKVKDPRWTKILIALGAVIMLFSGGTMIGVKSVIAKAEDAIQVENLLGDTGGEPKGSLPDGPLNMLMVGLDVRPNRDMSNARADTIIVLHIPASRDRAYLVSIPRDLMVDAKAFSKSGFGGGRAKMTETFYHGAQGGAGVAGGVELLAGTIKDRLGITFNAAGIINFESFMKVVETLGGVDLCIDQNVTSKHIYVDARGNPTNIEGKSNPSQYGKPAKYKKGECRRFKPWEALDFSRQRYGLKNGDYDRQRHQLQLMKAIAKEATGKGVLTNPAKINSVIGAAGAAFILDTRGVPIADFVLALGGIGGSLISLRTNAGKVTSTQVDGKSYETLTQESEQMFKAVANNTLQQFLVSHPDYLAPA